MSIRIRDDKGQAVTVEGDWSGRLVGQDFTAGGQILVWLTPGADGCLVPTAEAPAIPAPSRAHQLARQSRATPTNILQITEGN